MIDWVELKRHSNQEVEELILNRLEEGALALGELVSYLKEKEVMYPNIRAKSAAWALVEKEQVQWADEKVLELAKCPAVLTV